MRTVQNLTDTDQSASFINKQVQTDKYPLFDLKDFAQIMHRKKYFSKTDFTKAYHKTQAHADDMPKTAITMPFGLFLIFTVWTFGLACYAQIFHHFMLEVLQSFDYAFEYIGDVLISSSTE